MDNQAYSVVDNTIVRESLVTALMSEDPQSKADYSLADPVDWPEYIRAPCRQGWVPYEGGTIYQKSCEDQIMDEIAKGGH